MHTLYLVNDVTEGSSTEAPMGASYYVLAAAEGSTHNYPSMVGNLHQIGHFCSKHQWVLPGCFLL